MTMDFDTMVKLAIYRHFASTGRAPLLREVAAELRSDADTVRAAYRRLRTQRVLFLEPDDESIRADRLRAVWASIAQVFAAEPQTGQEEWREQEATPLAAGEGA